jgi:hypothetical protein
MDGENGIGSIVLTGQQAPGTEPGQAAAKVNEPPFEFFFNLGIVFFIQEFGKRFHFFHGG